MKRIQETSIFFNFQMLLGKSDVSRIDAEVEVFWKSKAHVQILMCKNRPFKVFNKVFQRCAATVVEFFQIETKLKPSIVSCRCVLRCLEVEVNPEWSPCCDRTKDFGESLIES